MYLRLVKILLCQLNLILIIGNEVSQENYILMVGRWKGALRGPSTLGGKKWNKIRKQQLCLFSLSINFKVHKYDVMTNKQEKPPIVFFFCRYTYKHFIRRGKIHLISLAQGSIMHTQCAHLISYIGVHTRFHSLVWFSCLHIVIFSHHVLEIFSRWCGLTLIYIINRRQSCKMLSPPVS